MQGFPSGRRWPAGAALGLALGLAVSLGAGAAHALPITLAVDETQSQITVDVTAVLTGSDTATVSGFVDADLDLGTLPSFAANSGDLAISDLAISASTFGNGFNINSENLVADLVGGPVGGSQLDAVTFEFDLAGFVLSIDRGRIFGDTFGGLVGDSTFEFDLEAEPFDFVLSSTIMTLVATPLGGDAFDVLATVPIQDELDLPAAETGLPADVTLGLNGSMVLNGTLVPEPGLLLLLASGVAGGVLFGRRRRA